VQELARGELMSLDNQIDVATGTLRLKARFANEDGRLFPNQFVNVILLVSHQEALAVPTAAVQVGSIGSFVYRVDDEGKAHIQRIVSGRVDGALVDVVSIDGQEVAARQAARSNGEGGGRRGEDAAAH